MTPSEFLAAVHALLDERMSNRYPSASEAVSIPYFEGVAGEKTREVPRFWYVESDTCEVDTQPRGYVDEDDDGGEESGIGEYRFGWGVRIYARTEADCRALAFNLVQCLRLTTDSPRIRWPLKWQRFTGETPEHGSRHKVWQTELVVAFPLPAEPQTVSAWVPSGPSTEFQVAGFVTSIEDPFPEPIVFIDEALWADGSPLYFEP